MLQLSHFRRVLCVRPKSRYNGNNRYLLTPAQISIPGRNGDGGRNQETSLPGKGASALQEENHYLKRLLEEAGILYVRQPEAAPAVITRQLARRFYSYFWGRMDVYSKRSVNKTTGKTQCRNACTQPAGRSAWFRITASILPSSMNKSSGTAA